MYTCNSYSIALISLIQIFLSCNHYETNLFLLVFMVSGKKNPIENVKLSFIILSYMFLFYNAFLYSTQDQQKKNISCVSFHGKSIL